MPRSIRVIVPGQPHHITQRGNYRQKVFDQPKDYQKYCYLAAQYCAQYGIDILAYCLMPNHIHFVVVPNNAEGMSRYFSLVHMCYSQYKNGQEDKKGHLWQGRFYSCVLDEAHLLHAVRYVERNPLRAGLVTKPEEYIWSSTAQRLELEPDPILKIAYKERITGLLEKGVSWAQYLRITDQIVEDNIRKETKRRNIVGPDDILTDTDVP